MSSIQKKNPISFVFLEGHRVKSATPGRPSARSPFRGDLARLMRERIYRQPLARPLPVPKRRTLTRGRVLHRQPSQPQYDPDFNYVDPDTHLHDARREVSNLQVGY